MRKLLVVVCLGFSAIIGLSSMKPSSVCSGCVAPPQGTTEAGPQGGWNLTIQQAVTSGICAETAGGACAAQSCASTILVSGFGPPSTTFSACYQTTRAPKYCVSPAPTTDANGNVNFGPTKRAGCGNDMYWEVSGPNGESKVTASMKCSTCQ